MINKIESGEVIVAAILALGLVIVYFLRKHKESVVIGDLFMLRSTDSNLVIIVYCGHNEISYVDQQYVGKGLKYIKNIPLYDFYNYQGALRIDRDPSFSSRYNILNQPILNKSKHKSIIK